MTAIKYAPTPPKKPKTVKVKSGAAKPAAKSPSTPASGSSTSNGDGIVSSNGLAGLRIPPFRNSPAITGANGPNVIDGSGKSMGRLYRGNLREYYDPNEHQPPASQIYHLDFFYNPSAVQIDYSSVNMDSYTPDLLTQTQLDHQTLANVQNLNTVSFSMIIDRTGVPDSQTPDQAVPEGVLRDVRIFEKLITHGFGGPNQYGYRPLALVRVRFSRHGGGLQPPLNYIGYISGTTVQYTRFNIDMVPTRCEISITLSVTVMNPELWIDSGGEAGYTVKSLGKAGTPLNAYDTQFGTLYLPGQGTRRSFFPGTSSTQRQSATPASPGVFGDIGGHGGAAQIAVNTAEAQVGKPYVFGAAGPNTFDCSGLTAFCWAAAGVSLPHNADSQFHGMAAVTRGSEVPGDIAFFGNSPTYAEHCGIITHGPQGKGEMIDAPHTGAFVRREDYHWAHLIGIGRPG